MNPHNLIILKAQLISISNEKIFNNNLKFIKYSLNLFIIKLEIYNINLMFHFHFIHILVSL